MFIFTNDEREIKELKCCYDVGFEDLYSVECGKPAYGCVSLSGTKNIKPKNILCREHFEYIKSTGCVSNEEIRRIKLDC